MCVIDMLGEEVDRCSRAIVAGSLRVGCVDVAISFDSLAVRMIQWCFILLLSRVDEFFDSLILRMVQLFLIL